MKLIRVNFNLNNFQIYLNSGFDVTVEPLLREHHQDLERCLFNRGENYKDYVSVLPARNRRTVPLIEMSQSNGSTVTNVTV